jgi:hypothetical protein
VARRAARRPHQNHHPVRHTPDGDQASLSIILTIILERQMIAVEHGRRLDEIQPSLGQGALALAWIEGDAHGYLLLQK